MELQTRAYATFEVKEVNQKKRIFTGWATTPALDRVNDSVNPLGARFRNPLVLLHQHKRDLPIGSVVFEKPTSKGIRFEAEIPEIAEPATLRERVDTAWGEILHGLVRGVSIGFKPLKYAFKDDGGVDYEEIEIFELSTVSIPALPEAVITSIKSMNEDVRLPYSIISTLKSIDQAARASAGASLSDHAAAKVGQKKKGPVILLPRRKPGLINVTLKR